MAYKKIFSYVFSLYKVSQNACMQPIDMMMIYYWDKQNAGHLENIL